MNGRLVESNFDLAAIVANRKRCAEYIDGMLKIPMEPTLAGFSNWSGEVPALLADPSVSYWLLDGQKCVKLDRLVFRVLDLAARNGVTIGWIVSNVPDTLRQGLFQYIKTLEVKGLVSFLSEGSPIRSLASVEEEERQRNSDRKSDPAWRIAGSESADRGLVQIASAPQPVQAF